MGSPAPGPGHGTGSHGSFLGRLLPLTMQDLEDKDLVRLTREGRSEAFGVLYERYVDGIYRYFLRRTGHDGEIARELAGEVFLRALEKLDSFTGQGSFRSWLYTIAHNAQVDWSTRRTALELTADVPDRARMSPEDQAARNGLVEVALRRVAEWSPVKRRVFSLIALADAPQREVARDIGRTYESVRQTYTRLRQELKDLLRGKGAVEDR